MVTSCNAIDLINEGLLIKPIYFHIETNIDISSESKVVMDDLTEQVLGETEHDIIIGADLIGNYKKRCDGKQAIVFCKNVNHAKEVAERFNKAGISAEFIECNTKNRKALLEAFEKKKFKILTCATLLAEGYDYPDLECVILFRKMGSRALYRQACNRCMRISPGKKNAYILDFFNNFSDHGVPWSTEEYSLSDTVKDESEKKDKIEKEDEDNKKNPILCPKCFNVIDEIPENKKCPFCKEHITETFKKIIIEIKNDLKQLDSQKEKELETKKVYTQEEKQKEYNKLCLKCIEKCKKPKWADGMYKKKFEVWPRKMKKPEEFIKYEKEYAKKQEQTIFLTKQLEWKMGLRDE
jgi:superfamily II DNA or RNA helicase